MKQHEDQYHSERSSKATIETRTQKLPNRAISEYLSKWNNLPIEDSTWEDENFIQKHPQLLKH